jgi:tetratricopeptide (TPR) repeat protein
MDKRTSLKAGGFSKAFNPHLKKNKGIKKNQEEEKKINQEMEILEQKEKSIPILISKEYLARQLIENGYIDSYIDFFYLGWKKTPNIKKNYTEIAEEDEEEEPKDEENIEEDQNLEDKNIPRHDFNLNNLENFYYKLKEAEDALRRAEFEGDPKYDEVAIDKYNLIRNDTLYQGVPLEAIYFNKKCIDIAKKNGHTESLIKSLIYMGDCFDKTNLPSDMNISKKLKEEARDIFKDKLEGKNYPLEMSIYKALKDLYSELATQQEQSKNYKKAIELLNKLLEILETAKSILNKISEKNKVGFNEKDIEDRKTEAYLKIANIYFIMKDFDNTISTLDLVPNIKSEDYSSLTVSIIIY